MQVIAPVLQLRAKRRVQVWFAVCPTRTTSTTYTPASLDNGAAMSLGLRS
jgi:hypothetical protein